MACTGGRHRRVHTGGCWVAHATVARRARAGTTTPQVRSRIGKLIATRGAEGFTLKRFLGLYDKEKFRTDQDGDDVVITPGLSAEQALKCICGTVTLERARRAVKSIDCYLHAMPRARRCPTDAISCLRLRWPAWTS